MAENILTMDPTMVKQLNTENLDHSLQISKLKKGETVKEVLNYINIEISE